MGASEAGICGCPRDHLCDACLEHSYNCLAGGAWRRGDAWAERVWAKAPHLHDQPWPQTPRARAMAERYVSDLTRDRLIARFADRCEVGARDRWAALQVEPERRWT